MARASDVRRTSVSGLFYPADPDELRQDVTALLKAAGSTPVRGRVRGLISPHAGYMYSGPTAARGYRLLSGSRYETVVIVSPSHREAFDGASVFTGSAYSTPLGTVKINTRLRQALADSCPFVHLSDRGHGQEHAIEVQLPFLQQVLDEFTLLPIVIGNQRPETCYALGEALGMLLMNEDALLVASTDLSHFYPGDMADRIDRVAIDDVERFDYEQLMGHLESGKTEACGGGPVVAVMAALDRMGVRHMEILHHCTSGDVTGDHGSVVGYLSAVAVA